LLGLIPGSYTVTSQIVVTAAFALFVYAMSIVVGFAYHGIKFFGILIPPGTPPLLLPLMMPIEVISQLARPLALAVRLFANMTAGHVVVLALIGLTFFFQSYLVGVAASVMATGIMLLELFVAFLQAFVFTLLTSVFIGLMREAH